MNVKETSEWLDTEVITAAFVLKATGADIMRLKQYMKTNNINIVFQTTSFGPLFISKKRTDVQD